MRLMTDKTTTEIEGYLTGDYETALLAPMQWPAHQLFPDEDERRKDLRNQVIRQGVDLSELLPEMDGDTKYKVTVHAKVEEVDDKEVWDVVFDDGSEVQVLAHDEINARRRATRKHNGEISEVRR
jgi:hypothetical protein